MNITVAYCLHLDSDLHVGSGLGGGAIKRRLLKHRGKKFIIPGSTIKGRVRHYCRQFIESAHDTNFTHQDIEHLFGTLGGGQKMNPLCAFSDLTTDDDIEFDLRNGITISRATGTTLPKALFNTETLIGNEKIFTGKIICYLPDSEFLDGKHLNRENQLKEITLLLIGLRTLDRIGGSKTAGLGKCRIPLDKIQLKIGNKTENTEEFILSHLEAKQ